MLKHTEQQLQMKLFERFGGRLHPTPEALAILPDLEDIFGRIDTLSRVAQELRDGRTGKLVIATSPTLVKALLPQAVAALRKSSPTVNVFVHSLPTPMAIDRVSRREADLGLVYAPVLDSALDAEDLLTTEMACVVPRGHALARKRAIHVRDLARRVGDLDRTAHTPRGADRGRVQARRPPAAGDRDRGELVARPRA